MEADPKRFRVGSGLGNTSCSMTTARDDDSLWNGELGAGGISWADRSGMGLLRGVIDAADTTGRRNEYMHVLHTTVVRRELRRANPLTSVLDFGCGTGRFIEMLAARCANVVAVDKEPSMIEAARRYAGGFGAKIVCSEPAKLPFDTATFDFTLCSSVLCVTMKALLPEIVCELARVTRPGGTLLLLERVCDDDDLPMSLYYYALARAGFTVERSYPIRFSSSLCTKWASQKRLIPVRLFPALAQLELFLTARGFAKKGSTYTQFAIVARR